MMGTDAIRVAVRFRPQSSNELAQQANECVNILSSESVMFSDKPFTFDFVFGQLSQQNDIYDKCVKGLVEGTFDGYNATVLAYGQTGSGKTYTMGTNCDSASFDNKIGIIPRAIRHLFLTMSSRKEEAKKSGNSEPIFDVSVQFVEIYNEEIIDLLTFDRSRMIKICEDPKTGEIYLKHASSQSVKLEENILEVLRTGALNRKTASTNMNEQSSRSHAIFTLMIKQQRLVLTEVQTENAAEDANTSMLPENEVEVLHAKFHFVDLAGSERLDRTGATGDRAKEGISINTGLLMLGNVINALASNKAHIPYRDSKLTRILQDSLGGNSRTLMIACASPSDIDSVETLNTLNYANRAKNIKNKVVANQDKSSKLISELRSRISALEAELNIYKQGQCPRCVRLDTLAEIEGEIEDELEELDGGIRVLIEKESEIDHDLCANIQDKMEVDSENIRDIDDETSEEREQICGDLVKLEEDINIKEKLIYELKKSEQKLAKLRHTYEQRLEKMLERIQATEAERDRILSEMSSKKQEDNKVQTVREEYEKRIYSMRQDFNRIRSESSENKKMHVQQQRQRMDLEKLQGELINLKRTKVDLMKRLKEENKRIREIQNEAAKRIAGFEKNARKQDSEMRRLQIDMEHKSQQLKRKNEEVQKLKEKTKENERRRRTLMPHQIAKTALHATNENMAAGPPSTINSADADAKDATYLLTESQKSESEQKFAVPSVRRRTSTTEELLHASVHVAHQMDPIQEVSSSNSSSIQSGKVPGQLTMSPNPDLRINSLFVEKFRSITTKNVKTMRLHASETQLISGSSDRKARIWDIETGSNIIILKNHQNTVSYVRLMPEEDNRAVTSSLNLIKIWDTRSAYCTHHLSSMAIVSEGTNCPVLRTQQVPPNEAVIFSLAFDSSNNYMFATSRNTVRIWDLRTLKYIGNLDCGHATDDELSAVAPLFTEQNKCQLFTGSKKSSLISACEVDLTFGQQLKTTSQQIKLLTTSKDTSVAYICTHDSHAFVALKNSSIYRISFNGEIQQGIGSLKAHDNKISSMCLLQPSPRSANLAREEQARSAFPRWTESKFPDEQSKGELPPPLTHVLTTICRGGSMKFWDITTPLDQPMRILATIDQAHTDRINDVITNTRNMFTSSDDGTIGVWAIH